jgi:hypothetical protein
VILRFSFDNCQMNLIKLDASGCITEWGMGMADKKSGPTADDIMSSAEMKPLLTKSKQEPVSCAIGLTKDKDGIVLLDKKLRPKQLLAELKKKAAKVKLDLDAPTLRFGQAHVDTEQEAGLVKFVVNKDTGGAMRPKLLEHLKKAGFGKLEIVVDAGFEAEPEDASGQDTPAPPGLSSAEPPAPPSTAGASSTAEAAPPAPPIGVQAAAASPPITASSTVPPAPPGPDSGGLTRSLTDLVRRLAQADPAQQGALKGLAVQAQAALKSGDAAGASASIEQLRAALNAGAAAGPATPAPPNGGGPSPPDGAAPAPPSGAAPGPPDSAAPAPPGTPGPAAKVAYAKARLAWLAARKKVEGDVGKLHDGLATAFKGHGKLPDLQSGFQARVEKVLNQLDEQLADKLDAVTKATDGAQHAKLVGEAKQVLQRYEAFIASDPTLKEIDANPFVPLSIQQTLTTTLSVLSKTIV